MSNREEGISIYFLISVKNGILYLEAKNFKAVTVLNIRAQINATPRSTKSRTLIFEGFEIQGNGGMSKVLKIIYQLKPREMVKLVC